MIRKSVFAAALTVPALAASADFATDFGVGRDLTGNLVVEFNFNNALEIGLSPDQNAFNGWFGDEPGFASFPEDEADEGIFRLEAGAQIQFELISADPGFLVYDPTFSSALGNGDTFLFDAITGDPADANTWSNFDDHPWWTVSRDDAGFDASIFSYDVTFQLNDVGSTGYGSTGPITVSFTRVPAPGAASLLGLTALAARRRR